ncbi:hypothetical protein XENTR_v10022147 [Xenopus tropicalis]|uniref:Uncharacterized protein LOC100486580 n=1 Tax=Xenopus tropicalis TaxID=8364 RepID=A0A8J0QTF2_XENTR|nr:uncharacterized protein LOC100486580 [Xenopus tropicalis]KAE8587848.1 hypothetical protein XENTR_v10022147 [Xenopus tropicalis]
MFLRSIVGWLLTVALLPLALSRQVYTTSYGGTCTTACKQSKTGYYWCEQKGGNYKWWDYCSPKEGYDSNYRPCLSGCQKIMGSKYEQCFTSEGWSKCGHVVEEFESYYTSDNALCVTDCMFDREYFICTDIRGKKQKCSPLKDVTAKGETCRKDHPCDSHGNGYTWCYTSYNKDWGYCGKVLSDCEYHHRTIRADGDKEICRITDRGNRRELVLTAIPVPDTDFRRPLRVQYTEASRLINTIDANFYFPNRIHTMASSDDVRLDMQGSFQHDGVRYLNVQLQLNQPRGERSTTIAQILFPQDLDTVVFSRYIRRALHTSMTSSYYRPPVKIIITMNRI